MNNNNVGRNQLCPCGSGAKYKKCCLAKDEAQRKPHTGEDAVLVCMPTRGQVCHETLQSIEHNLGVKYTVCRVARKPVVEARNFLAKHALEAASNPPFAFVPRNAYILWLDDDAWVPPGVVPQMVQCLNERSAVDALFAWFSPRAPHSAPVAFKRIDDSASVPRIGVDCHFGDVVDIEAAGFHAVLMRPRLLERIGPDPFSLHKNIDEGEDFAFCRRAKAIGARLVVATGLPVFHVDARNGLAYTPGQPPLIIDGNDVYLADIDSAKADVRGYGMGALEEKVAEASAASTAALRREIETRERVSRGLEQYRAPAESLV